MNMSTSCTIKVNGVGRYILIKFLARIAGNFGLGTTNLDVGYWEFRGVWADDL